MLSKDDIVRLLNELADELEAQGIHGDLFLVGGAAMALAYSARRATRDLDAVFEPKQVIYQAAHRVGNRHGLPDDWLNDGVKGFLPGSDPGATVLFDRPGLAASGQAAAPIVQIDGSSTVFPIAEAVAEGPGQGSQSASPHRATSSR